MMCLHANSRQDPTNTGGARRKLIADMRKRMKGALDDVRALIERIPYTVTEVQEDIVTNRRVYRFDLTDIDTDAEIRRIVEAWFATGANEPPPRWFFESYVADTYGASSMQSMSRINTLLNEQAYNVEQILLSRPYRARIDKVVRRAFEDMKGFSGDLARDLGRTLGDAMASGEGVRSIRGKIAERFDVKMSRAETIARTELGNAHRQARQEMAVDARDRLGLTTMMQWVSALAPTTRPSHAERHLNLYTPEEVASFYSEDGNSINCLCTQVDVVVTEDGQVLGERKETERDKREVKRIVGNCKAKLTPA